MSEQEVNKLYEEYCLDGGSDKRVITLIEDWRRLQERVKAEESHGQPCYYCKEPVNDLAADPGKWGVPLCHSDDPGVVKFHHVACVYGRLQERNLCPS